MADEERWLEIDWTAVPAGDRAERGAALLDAGPRPDWWRPTKLITLGRIDLPRLNIDSPHECVLGQVYGGYTAGLGALGMFENPFTDWFFRALWCGFATLNVDDLVPLTTAWRTLITERRAVAS